MNYREYAKVANYTSAAKLIERAVSRLPQADGNWQNRVIADVKKNVGGITLVKKGD